jgi:peptide-methionine (S)-S-oxide reductase
MPATRFPIRHALGAIFAALIGPLPALAAEPAVPVPAPVVDVAGSTPATATAVLAGGCFWGVQGVFQHVAGVTQAESGYSGGSPATALYPLVGTGSTGHAEAVRIVYDPKKISYGRLLQIYFSVAHNPTQLNYQGPDRGPQYRSAIFPTDAEQERVARAYIAQLDQANTFGRKLATTVEPLKGFYPAESYHQDFLTRNPRHPYIVMHDLPKLTNLQKLFPERYQATPVLVGTGAAKSG